MSVCLFVCPFVYLSVRPSIRRSHLRSAGFELMMSVLPLPTDSCCLVLVVKTNARFQSPWLNNADVLFSYRVINSFPLVKTIKYQFSLYSYCYGRIKHACSSWFMHVIHIQVSSRIPAHPLSHWYKTPYIVNVKVRPYERNTSTYAFALSGPRCRANENDPTYFVRPQL